MENHDSWTRIDPPIRLSDNDIEQTDWFDSADVVVVGFGGAGVCAAIQAKQLGVDTLAVDRFNGGGATAYSGGVVYAGGTRVQKEAAFNDTAEQMHRYLSLEVGDAITDETLHRFCEGSNDDFEWLCSLGVQFSSDAFLEKTAYPPDGKFLYYSGNEMIDGFKDKAEPAPRGHRTIGKGFSGYNFYGALRQAAEKIGVRGQLHSRATRLLIDSKDRVIGLEVLVVPASHRDEHQKMYARVNPQKPFNTASYRKVVSELDQFEQRVGERKRIRATKGVILSTGGYAYNNALLRRDHRLLADHFDALVPLASPGSDGSGIEMGQSAGGAAELMDSIFTTCSLAPPSALLEGIAVNNLGQRFIGETAYGGHIGKASVAQPSGETWLILDGHSFWKAIRQIFGGIRSGLFILFLVPVLLNILFGGTRRARSVEKLANRCAIDSEGLAQTLQEYNALTERGEFDSLAKPGKYLRTLNPPYYAINLCIDNKFALRQLFTLGGLRVDEDSGRVKRADGAAINGLYAAGRTAIGLCSIGYVSGMSLADCVFSGRRAGRHCAEAGVT